jgi:hypothetical protein
MAWIDGYDTITPAGDTCGSAPGTEKTNEARPSPGPSWSKSTLRGPTPGKPTGSDSDTGSGAGY